MGQTKVEKREVCATRYSHIQQVACPRCYAKVGYPCITSKFTVSEQPHAARVARHIEEARQRKKR